MENVAQTINISRRKANSHDYFIDHSRRESEVFFIDHSKREPENEEANTNVPPRSSGASLFSGSLLE
jgi:hypothetical protein